MSGTWLSGWVAGDVVSAAEYAKGLGSFYDSTLGAAAANFSITPPTWGSHLMLIASLRGSTGAVTVQSRLRFNSDSTANYGYENLRGNVATASASGLGGETSVFVGTVTADTASAGRFGHHIIFVPNFRSTTIRKGSLSISGQIDAVSPFAGHFDGVYGLWDNTAAVTNVTLLPSASTWAAGSRVVGYVLGP